MAPDNDQLQQAGSWLVRLTGPGGGLAWMFILAIWGGTVSYLTRLRSWRLSRLAYWVSVCSNSSSLLQPTVGNEVALPQFE